MKIRIAALAFALCFVSSLALADNPSEAPPASENAGSAVVGHGERTGCSRQHRNKKDVRLRQQPSDATPKSEHQKAGRTSYVPAQTDLYGG
jgi:hypothetical protein